MRNLPRSVLFFKTSEGNEPVRERLKSLTKEEKRIIGEDIKTVQGTLQWRKPLMDFLGNALWEIRITLPDCIARVFFFESHGEMILLHGFKKKTQKTPLPVIQLVKERKKQYEHQQKK